MFEGFTEERVDVGESSIFVRHGGAGPAVLLLHGHPRTSATCHRVAPLLVSAGCTVICPDLRGYGRSTGPTPTADHAAHSKRAVAADLAAVMNVLGHQRFAVAGHDRCALSPFGWLWMNRTGLPASRLWTAFQSVSICAG
jgi:haloacetate dehalogenase